MSLMLENETDLSNEQLKQIAISYCEIASL